MSLIKWDLKDLNLMNLIWWKRESIYGQKIQQSRWSEYKRPDERVVN